MNHRRRMQRGSDFGQVTYTCNTWQYINEIYGMSHRDESACGFGDEGNLSSSFRMALISGTAGSWGDRLASELMNSVCRVGRWNGPALSGRGTNTDWSEPAHASPGDSTQHEFAAVAMACSSSPTPPPGSTDVLGRSDWWPLEVAEDLGT